MGNIDNEKINKYCNMSYIEFITYLRRINSSSLSTMHLDEMHGLYLCKLDENTMGFLNCILESINSQEDKEYYTEYLNALLETSETIIMGYNLPTNLDYFTSDSPFHIILGVDTVSTVELTVRQGVLHMHDIIISTYGRISSLTYNAVNNILTYGRSRYLPKYINLSKGTTCELPFNIDIDSIPINSTEYDTITPMDIMHVSNYLNYKYVDYKGFSLYANKYLTTSLISDTREETYNSVTPINECAFYRETPLLQYSAFNDTLAVHYAETNMEECYVSSYKFCKVLGILSPFEARYNFLEKEEDDANELDLQYYYGKFDDYYSNMLPSIESAPYRCDFLIAKLSYLLKMSVYVKNIYNMHYTQDNVIEMLQNLGTDENRLNQLDIEPITINLPCVTSDGFKFSPFQPCIVCLDVASDINDIVHQVWESMGNEVQDIRISSIESKSYDTSFNLKQYLGDYNLHIGFAFYGHRV